MDSVEVYIDKDGEHRFRIRSSNGQIRAVSSEGYKSPEDCLKCIIATRDAITLLVADCCRKAGEALEPGVTPDVPEVYTDEHLLKVLKAANLFQPLAPEPKSLADAENQT